MAKNSVANLLSVDSLFTTQEEREEAQREVVANIPISEISLFPNHPFKVRVDADMMDLAESVRQHGVLEPALVRPKPGGGYEMVAGHRRLKATELAEKFTLPCIVRDLTDDEATIIMVDSNLQREQILPSEKAFAYKISIGLIDPMPKNLILCLCCTCANNFYGTGAYALRRIDPLQVERELCTYCNSRLGYNYEIVMRKGKKR